MTRVFVVKGVGAVLAVMMVAGLCGTASAVPILRLENVGTGTGVVIVDGGAGNVNPLAGVITFVGPISGFVVNVTTAITKPVAGYRASLDLNSVNVQVAGPGTLQICAGETGFGFPPDGLAEVNGEVGGTLTQGGSTQSATFQSWANPGNTLPGYGPPTPAEAPLLPLGLVPVGSVAAWTPVAFTTGPGAFSSSDSSYFFKNGPYSIFVQADLVFTGPGSVSFNESQLVTSAPEPATLLLLGLGAVPFIRRLRRAA